MNCREEDVTRTIYKNTAQDAVTKVGAYSNPPSTDPRVPVSKVNRICHTFLRALKGKDNYTQNLISAYVCQNPPNLDDGLRQIAGMIGRNIQGRASCFAERS